MRAATRARTLPVDALMRLFHVRAYRTSAVLRADATLQSFVASEGAKGAVAAARTLDPSGMAGAVPMPDPTLIKDMAMPLKIAQLVEAVSSLNLVECMLFSEGMRRKMGMPADLMLTTASAAAAAAAAGAAPAAAGGAAAAKAAPGAAAAAAAPAAAPAAEKTTVRLLGAPSSQRAGQRAFSFLIFCASVFPFPFTPPSLLPPQVDIKLVSFKAESKIKVIKEVRSITSLGLKEVRKLAPTPAPPALPSCKRPHANAPAISPALSPTHPTRPRS